MGIQLDWQIEAEHTEQRDTEDPESRRRRRRQRRQLLLAILFVAMVICGVVGFLLWRVNQLEQRVEDDLRAAVDAELAAIRIGNQSAFMNIQRSASEPWLDSQRALFVEYQTLKQAQRLSPDSEIVDVAIDEQRGRVVLHEQIDGITYRQVWFYWNYEPLEGEEEISGWRHVPQDWTFWGDEQTLEGEGYQLTYYELDAPHAQAIANRLDSWWQQACTWVACPTPPDTLEIIIDPQAGIRYTWEPQTGWKLRVLSPLVTGRVPINTDTPTGFEFDTARAITERLIDHATSGRLQYIFENALIAFDTTWVKYELRDWIAGQMTGQPSPFINSLVALYGDGVVPALVQQVSDGGQIDSLAPMVNPQIASFADLDDATLNQIEWRPFFEWRLGLERERLRSGDFDNYFALYESGSNNAAAQARAANGTFALTMPERVEAVAFTRRPDLTLVALLTLVDDTGNTTQTSYVWTGDTFIRVD